MNILITGVGGQGVVLASKLLAQCGILLGQSAHTAETIGMAQRGGSVTSHVRLGAAHSPLIPRGGADILLAFEPAEAARNIAFLKPDGALVVSNRGIAPSGADYAPAEVLAWLRANARRITELDADALFAATGSYRGLNVALIGASAGLLGISPGTVEAALRDLLGDARAEQNFAALRFGAGAAG